MASTVPRTAVTNVRVFDGRHLQPPGTVVIEAGRISSAQGGALVIDGEGSVLPCPAGRPRPPACRRSRAVASLA